MGKINKKKNKNKPSPGGVNIFTIAIVLFALFVLIISFIANEKIKNISSREDYCIENGYECYGAGLNQDECGYYLDTGSEPWNKKEVCGKSIWRDGE